MSYSVINDLCKNRGACKMTYPQTQKANSFGNNHIDVHARKKTNES